MYIQKIQLQGFKSFLNKTTIDLNRGLTTIVGPNGCGKTNVIDAVRWVLGEQKQSMLRSSKMEDIIFNGTTSKKPINFCEVKIIINNDIGLLPVEYSVVEVSRRLFRSGESEYYINKTPCRLKDVLHLFIDTGMSSNAYSVIELKMIERILLNDNSNLKNMLDAASGISNYNQQRKQTNNKLKLTLNDLDRVNDIISEVGKNIKLFKLQMKRYKKHKTLSDKLKTNEILLSSLKIKSLINKEKPILDSLKTKDSDQVKLVKQINKNEKLIKEIEKKNNSQKQKINKIQLEIKNVNDKIIESNNSIIKLTENKKYNNSQIEHYNDQISQSIFAIENIDKKIIELNNLLFSLDPKMKSLDSEFDLFSKKYNKAKKKKEQLVIRIEKEQKKMDKLFEDKIDFKNKINLIESEIKSIKSHLSDLKKFKYDKNCKYCLNNGQEQINEQKDLKIKLSTFKKKISNYTLELKNLKLQYAKQSKITNKLNEEFKNYNNRESEIEFHDLKIKKIELEKEKEGVLYRIDSFTKNKIDSKNKINFYNKNIKSLKINNDKIDKILNKEKKAKDRNKFLLEKKVDNSNDLESVFNTSLIKLRKAQQDLVFTQKKKEEKIIDKQTFDIKISELQNEKKIIKNFIQEKYNEDIYNYFDNIDSKTNSDDLSNQIHKIKKSIENIGPINMGIEDEYNKELDRFNFLNDQKQDLIESEETLQKTIKKLDKEAKKKFMNTFDKVNNHLKTTFPMFFEGGESYLKLTDLHSPLESDVEIVAKPPGKKIKTLKMLSEGEKALTAISVLFAIYLQKPSPFCILDEVDSPLDDINVKKFTSVLRKFSNKTQFIIITHNKLTMNESDYMYGITQQDQGISKIVSVNLAEG